VSEGKPEAPAQDRSQVGSQPGSEDGLLATLRRFSRLWMFALVSVLLLVFLRRVVLPFVFGALIAYLLEPLVRRTAPRLGRAGAVILVYVVLFAAMLGFFGGLLPRVVSDLSTLRESTPEAVQTFNEEWLPRASAWFEQTFPSLLPEPEQGETATSEILVRPQPDGSYRVDLEAAHLEVREHGSGWVIEADAPRSDSFGDILRELVASKGDELTQVAADAVRSLVTGVANFVTDFAIAFLVAAFVLIDQHRVQRFFTSLVPREQRADFDELLQGVEEGMAGVVRGQILICVINGALAYVGLLVFGVHYALLLAMVAAVLSVIPVAGILIATVPILGVALVSGDLGLQGLAFGKSAAMLGWLVAIHLLEANYLNPKIIGTAANIHPVFLLFALLAGFELSGLLGALLAIPLASVVQTLFLYARRHGGAERDAQARGRDRDRDRDRDRSGPTTRAGRELRASSSSSNLVRAQLRTESLPKLPVDEGEGEGEGAGGEGAGGSGDDAPGEG